mgnify:CR=1 FL=1
MEITVAKSAGFCFGVQRAVDSVYKELEENSGKIYTFGPIIHNEQVVEDLNKKGIEVIDTVEQLKKIKEGTVVIRSHGVAKEIYDILEQQKLKMVDATCPFVTNIQKKVNKFSNEGYKIVILGDENHPEVIGINGWCNDSAIITKDGSFNEKLSGKVCVVSQTTEKEENWDKTINNLSINTYDDLKSFNTICAATEERQKSVYELSKKVDFMVVVGGKHSSNTTKLYEIAKKNCENTIHIENAKEISKDILKDKDIKTIGVTAGASTPDWIIKEVINIMEGF